MTRYTFNSRIITYFDFSVNMMKELTQFKNTVEQKNLSLICKISAIWLISVSHSGGESWGALPPNLKRRQNNQTLINTKYLHKWCNSVVTNWTLEDLRLWLVALLRSISLNNKEFTYICKYFTEFTKNQNKSPKAYPVRNNSCFKTFCKCYLQLEILQFRFLI